MKKILSIMSLVLVSIMLVAVLAIGVFANENSNGGTLNDNGAYIYNVDGMKAAVADGTIGEDEYTTTLTFDTPVFYTNYPVDSIKTPTESDLPYLAEQVKMSFSHDTQKIYIGLEVLSGTTTNDMRDGYAIRFGFDPEHPENYIGLYAYSLKLELDSSSSNKKTLPSDLLKKRGDGYDYNQAGYNGLVLSNGGYYWQANKSDFDSTKPTDGRERVYYNDETASTYPITAMKLVREDVDGALTLGTYGSTKSGQVRTYFEIEIDKALMLTFFNRMYDTEAGETPISDLSTMLFSFASADTKVSGINSMWNGYLPEGDYSTGTTIMPAYCYDQIVFSTPTEACQHTTITPATCEQPAKCAACGETDLGESTQAALGHNWKKIDDAVAATCTTAGKTQKDECINDGCDATQGGTTVKATGHKWVAGEGTVAKYCDNENCDAQINVAVDSVAGYKTVAADGTINDGEYLVNKTYTTKKFITNYPVDGKYDSTSTASESVTVGFSHDAGNIYIGISDLSADTTSTIRQGYTIRFGFDPAHPENYIGLHIQCADFSPEGNGANNAGAGQVIAANGTSKVSDLLQPTSVYEWAQGGARGLALSAGQAKWQANLSASTGSKPTDGLTRLYYTSETAATYPITAMKMTKKAGDAEITFANHGRTSGGQVTTYLEIKIDKNLMKAFFNQAYDTENGETPVVDLNTMLFSIATVDTLVGHNVLWNGTMHEDYATDYAAKQTSYLESYGFDKVVFSAPTGCQHTTITPATCEEPAKCADCGDTALGDASQEKLGHDWQKLDDAVAAGCITAGKTQKDKCGRDGCDATRGGDPVKATGHTWAVGEGTVAKYCTVDGCDTEINVAVTTVNGYAYKGTVAADGTIGATEYTESVDYNDPKYYVDFKGCGTTLTGNASAATYHQQEVSVSFAHDADKIYVGIYDLSGTAASLKNNYVIRFGFDPEHPENYIGLFVGDVNMTAVSGDSTKVEVNNMLKADNPNDPWDYPQAGVYGLAVSHGETWWNPLNLNGSEDGIPRVFYNAETAATYPITAMKMVKEAVTGDFTKSNYDATCVHKTYFEIEIDKDLMLDFFNQMYDEDKGETPIANLNTMLFSVQTAERKISGENVVWNGTYGDDYEIVNYSCDTYGFDRVNFIDCPHAEWDDATCTAPKTCKACGETEGDALEHVDENTDHACDNGCNVPQGDHADGDDANHTCDYCGGVVDGETCTDENPKDHVCDECGETVGEHADGDDNNHTCDYCGGAVEGEVCVDTTPKDHVCDECGATVGEHADGDDANHTCDYCGGEVDGETCTDENPKDHVCDECGATVGEHADGDDANHTCDYCGGEVDGEVCADVNPADHVCDECGATISSHTGGTATCEAKAECDICGEEYGDFADHDWVDADCTTPKTCSVCEETDGDALGHDYNIVGKKATCTVCQTVCVHAFDEGAANCKHCNIEKAVVDACEHVWLDATCTSAEVCDECGISKPDSVALGHADIDNDHICDRENCNVKVSDCTGGTATCEAKAVCTVCGKEYGDFAAHTWVAADCDTPKTCSACQATEGEALGHTWVDADCTTPKTCSVCQATEGEALGHDYNIVGKKATCTVCQAVCVHAFDEGATNCKHCNIEKAVVDACEHTTWIPATCTTPKTCDDCGITEGTALGHTEVVDAAVAATCTQAGLTEGKHCSVCNTVFVAQTEIAALGHTEVVDAAVAATCTTAGLTEGKHCSVCNTVTVAQTEVAALGHTEVVDAAVAATCTTAGLTEGKHCSVCNTVTVAQTEVAALGHAYDDDNDATCNTCGDVREVETDEVTTGEVTTEAPTTEAPAEEKGCGGSVGIAGLALVAALGTCTVFVAKKKED